MLLLEGYDTKKEGDTMGLSDFVVIWIASSSLIFFITVLVTNKMDTGKFFLILNPKRSSVVQKKKNLKQMDCFFLIWAVISLIIGMIIASFSPLPLLKMSRYLRDFLSRDFVAVITISAALFLFILLAIGRSNSKYGEGKYFVFFSQSPDKERREKENARIMAYLIMCLANYLFLVWCTVYIIKKMSKKLFF